MKKLIALLLAAVLCISLLAACGSSGSGSAEDETTETAETAGTAAEETEGPAETEEAEEEAAAEEDEEDEETASIEVYIVGMSEMDQDAVQDVSNAISEVTVPEINVAVSLHVIAFGEYLSSIPMQIAGGEQIDLCCIIVAPPVNFGTMYASGQLMDISGLIDTYGSNIMDTVGDYLAAYTVDGAVYGVPTFRNYSSSVYVTARADMLDELNLREDYLNMESFSDLEAIMEQIHTNFPDIYTFGGTNTILFQSGYLPTSDSFADCAVYDRIGDDLNMICAPSDGSGQLTALVREEGFINACKKAAEWNEKGWVWPETVLTDTGSTTACKNGLIWGYTTVGELNVAANESGNSGYEILAVKIQDVPVSTSTISSWGVGVPVTAKEPEAAIKFLDLLYVRDDLMNMINWGIEGRDYVIEDGQADYPDGASEVPYHNADWMIGNAFICAPWTGDGADSRQAAKAALDSAVISPYVGFVMDTSELSDEIAALTNVRGEYWNSIVSGEYTDDLYNEMISAFESAGMDDYIAAFQSQLDAWSAS